MRVAAQRLVVKPQKDDGQVHQQAPHHGHVVQLRTGQLDVPEGRGTSFGRYKPTQIPGHGNRGVFATSATR